MDLVIVTIDVHAKTFFNSTKNALSTCLDRLGSWLLYPIHICRMHTFIIIIICLTILLLNITFLLCMVVLYLLYELFQVQNLCQNEYG